MGGGAWLLLDMAVNIGALSIVKALGLGYPAVQLVFLRASVGLLLMLPWALRRRRAFLHVTDPGLHALRVVFSGAALMASFFALPRLPFSLFTAISFTRPVVTMILAILFLREAVSGRRWAAAGVAFVGVLIAVEPAGFVASWGVPAMGLAVFCGTAAIILTRKLTGAPDVVLMTFYTVGLTALTAPLAAIFWVPIAPEHIAPLLAIGVLAQSAQFCFLQAHRRAEAGFLAVLGYMSLIFTTAVGYLFFDEVPTVPMMIGAALIIAAAVSTTLPQRRR